MPVFLSSSTFAGSKVENTPRKLFLRGHGFDSSRVEGFFLYKCFSAVRPLQVTLERATLLIFF